MKMDRIDTSKPSDRIVIQLFAAVILLGISKALPYLLGGPLGDSYVFVGLPIAVIQVALAVSIAYDIVLLIIAKMKNHSPSKNNSPSLKKAKISLRFKPMYLIPALLLITVFVYVGYRQYTVIGCNDQAKDYTNGRSNRFNDNAIRYDTKFTVCMRDKGFEN